MVFIYAKELQSNRDKYTMKYISEVVKIAFEKKLITLEDLYHKKESELCTLFESYISSWKTFTKLATLTYSETKPEDGFFISFDTKKRNVIPLVYTPNGNKRVTEISKYAENIYKELSIYQDSKYAYTNKIKKLY